MRKQFSPTSKAKVVHELLKKEQPIARLTAAYGVHPTQLGKRRSICTTTRAPAKRGRG